MAKPHPADDAANSLQPLEPRRLMSGDGVALPYRLDFDADAGGLLDADGQGTGFHAAQGGRHVPADLDLDADAGLLRLTVPADSTGGNHRGDDSLRNALQIDFDGTNGFVAETRLVGENGGTLQQLDAKYEQAGLLVGPGPDRFVKLVAIHHDDGPRLQFADEWLTDGTYASTTGDGLVYAGEWNAITSLDLRVTADAATGEVRASFRVDDGAWQDVPHATTVPAEHRDAFFAADATAGIVAFHKNAAGGGFGVNYDSFEVRPPDAAAFAGPRVVAARPAAGATDVNRDAFVAVDIDLPNGAIDGSTVTPTSVYLLDLTTNTAVPARTTVSGGGDAITLTPKELLAADRSYRFVITGDVRDVSGAAFAPFAAEFTTGTSVAASDPRVAFDRSVQSETVGIGWTGLTFGPDGDLYGTTSEGQIYRFGLAADGTLRDRELLFDYEAATGVKRLITGLAFDPSAGTPTAYVSHGEFVDPGDEGDRTASEWSGVITRFSGVDLASRQDVIVDLPRSVYDHLNNQPVFGPDGRLYWVQPSNTAMGDPDATWGWRPERLLTAAVLSADVRDISSTLSVKTEAGGSYDPYAPDAPVTIHATGVRNGYDLVFTAGGHLFLPANGSAAGGNAPGVGRIGDTQHDYLFRVEAGGYYGHPNPLRNELILNGGNPTAADDVAEVSEYDVGTQPEANWRGFAHDFGTNVSPNGAIQYDSGGQHFGGALDGRLVVVRYSGGDDLILLDVDEATGQVVGSATGSFGTGGFADPLDVVQDPATGNLYVVEAGFRSGGTLQISLLTPVPTGGVASVDSDARDYGSGPTLHLSGVVDQPGVGQAVTITNTGTAPLAFPADAFTIDGPDAARFRLVGLPNDPQPLQPGERLTFNVEHIADAVAISTATLTVKTNDLSAPSQTFRLRGLGTAGEGGDLEPSLQRILDLYGLPIDVADPDPDTVDYPDDTIIPGSNEVTAQLFRAAGGGPVTVELLASMGTAIDNEHDATSVLGYYPDGDPAAEVELLRVDKLYAQTLSPRPAAASFVPTGDFGLVGTFFDFGPRKVYGEDDRNTWEPDADERRKLRVFPLKDAGGAVVPNAYVFAFEEWDVASDQNDLVGIIRGVTAAGVAPDVAVENADGVPFDDRLVMNRIEHLDPVYANSVRDTATLIVRNTGSGDLTIDSVSVDSPDFEVVSGGDPGTIPAGGQRSVVVRFVYSDPDLRSAYGDADVRPLSRLVKTGTLTITTNDPDEPTVTATLGGLWQSHSEEGQTGTSQEPNLNEIVAAFGYSIDVGPNTGQGNYGTGQNTDGDPIAVGQETLSPYWQKAGGGQVEVIQLAAFHQQRDPQWDGTGSPRYWPNTSFNWHRANDPVGGAGCMRVFKHARRFGQSILPLIEGETGLARGTFDPGSAAFGVSVDQAWHSDPQRNRDLDLNDGVDRTNDHAFRFFAVRDADGNVVPDAYVAAEDNGGSSYSNYDYQDNVYLLRNVRPVSGPSAPRDLSAVGGQDGVALSWDANPEGNLAGYDVLRAASAAGPFTKLNSTPLTATAFVDGSAPAGEESYYRVVAVDYHGTAGTGSTASATPTAGPSVPSQPTGLATNVVSHGRIELMWTDNATNEAGYRVERATGNGSFVVVIDLPADAASWADTNADGATTYRYRVVAHNAAGISKSAVAEATTPPDLTAPAGVTADAQSHDRVVISWNDVSDNEDGFRVERAAGNGGFATIATTAAGIESYADTTVAADTTYRYRVAAVAGGSSGSASNVATATTPDDPSDVATPTDLRVTSAAPYTLSIAWTHDGDNATGYDVERAIGDGPFTSLGSTTATTFDDGTQPETTYRYRVRAVNAVGGETYTSDFAQILTVTTPADQSDLAAPANLDAVAFVHTQVELTWDDVRFETRYTVQRRPAGGTFETIAVVGTDATGYLDTGRSAATTYEYRVAAGNSLAPLGPWSDVATVTTPSADQYVSSNLGDAAGSTAVVTPRVDFDLSAAGTQVGTRDDVRLVHRPVVGDFDVIVRLDSFDKASSASAAGLMVRDDLSPTARNVFLRASGDVALSYRDVVGGDTTVTGATPAPVPVYLRLTRSGDRFTGLVSGDGVAWTAVASTDVAMSGTLRLGLAVASYSDSPSVARFRGLGSYEQQPPAAPADFAAVAQGTASVRLTWADAASNEAGYRVERRAPGSPTWGTLATLANGSAAYTDATVAPGGTYDYRVVAFNAAGDAPSDAVTVDVTAAPPGPPDGSTGGGDPPAVRRDDDAPGTAVVGWPAAGGDVDGYVVERRAGTDGDWRRVTTVAADVRSLRDASAGGGVWQYRVRAVGPGGVGEPTAPLTVAVAEAERLDRPTLAVDRGRTAVRLTWTDDSRGEDGYAVQRRLPGGRWVTIGRTPANATGFTDRAASGETAEYRVRAEGLGRLGRWSGGVEAEAPLESPRTLSRLGGAAAAYGDTLTDEHIDLTSGGGDVWGFEDEAAFAHREVSGDFDLAVRVVRIDGDDPGRMAGLMARASADAGSRNVFLKVRPTDVRLTARRLDDGQAAAVGAADVGGVNRWLRLRRDGDTLIGYVRVDGDWTEVARQQLSFGETALVGVAASARSSTGTATAVFRDLTDLTLAAERPTAPVSLAAVSTAESVRLTWPTVAPEHVVARRLIGGDWQRIGLVGNGEYLDTEADGLAFEYRVAGVSPAGVGPWRESGPVVR